MVKLARLEFWKWIYKIKYVLSWKWILEGTENYHTMIIVFCVWLSYLKRLQLLGSCVNKTHRFYPEAKNRKKTATNSKIYE